MSFVFLIPLNVTCLTEDNNVVASTAYLLHAYVYDTLKNLLGYLCSVIYIHTFGMCRVPLYLHYNTYYWLPNTPYLSDNYLHNIHYA